MVILAFMLRSLGHLVFTYLLHEKD